MTKQNNLTEAEQALIEAHRKQQKQEQDLQKYRQQTNKAIQTTLQKALRLQQQMAAFKRDTFKLFDGLIDKKEAIFQTKKDRRSNCFTNEEKNMRVTLGCHQKDYYLDTAEDGILLVKQYIGSLARTPETETLVKMVLDLLAKDKTGQLSAKNILLLQKYADESGDMEFVTGVRTIQQAYSPILSKQYIRVEQLDDHGLWRTVPLTVTDC